jgi:hypothetical protein
MAGNRQKRSPEKMREEYDFSDGIRGKYAKCFADGSSIAVLDPDVATVFRDSESVDRALRALCEIAERQSRKTGS